MAYSTRLIIGEAFDIKGGSANFYFHVEATVEIGKCSLNLNQDSKIAGKCCYIYASNGRTVIIKDGFDNKLVQIKIKSVIDALKHKLEESDKIQCKYALALLESMEQTKNNFSVLFFVH